MLMKQMPPLFMACLAASFASTTPLPPASPILPGFPLCAGKSDAEPADIDLSQFADVLVQNYGAFENNRERLIGLQTWARDVQLWYADLVKQLQSGK